MDSTFFLTVVAAEIGSFWLFGDLIFLMLYRKFRFYQENKDMVSLSSSLSLSSPTSSLSPSSPTSSFSCNWTHDVFPSFRGEDVRKTFLSHIQKEFRRQGIIMFIDNDIKRGESIGPELILAIRRSKGVVILVSRNYASSTWCLDELVEIMKCKEELGQMVFVIFYEVDPSDVKKLTGDFGAVFKKTCQGKAEEDVRRWRQALEKVATIAGYHTSKWDNEAVMTERIVTEISKRLINFIPASSGIECLIGMGAHMESMKLLLCSGSDDVKMIGIWGLPGIGKTTIARFVYNQICHGFELSVFMKMESSYARPFCSDDYDVKLYLEQQLLTQLTNQKDLEISRLGALQTFLMNKKVLVILDGVDHSTQLSVMPKVDFLGQGTRIIITTQNRELLTAFNMEHIYPVDLPPYDEALQIFCMYAFGQDSPYDGFEKLAWEVIHLAGSLPLGLRIMGSHLRGKSKEDWEEELPRLRIRLTGETESILKYSYDALEEEDKDLFLCICFFQVYNDVNEGIFQDIVRHRFLNVRRGLKVLVQRSLVFITDHKYFSMHRLLIQLGRDIIRNQSIHEPGKRRFLFDAKEICEVLVDCTGSRSVIGINLNSDDIKDEDLYISERAFEGMSDLQFLRISGWEKVQLLLQGLYLSPKLRILHWDHYPMKCFPSTFNPKFLVKIVMRHSKLEKLWEGIQPLGNLKFMDLSVSENLKELPNLSTATKLEKMDISYCSSLVEIPSSTGNLTKLQKLDIMGCSSLVKLPSSIGNLTQIQGLDIMGCSSLVKLPSSIGNLTQIQGLLIMGCSSLVELPSSIGNLTNLQYLSLYGCSSLVKIPSSIGNLTNLRKLDLRGCLNVVELPSSIGSLTNLQKLNIGYGNHMQRSRHNNHFGELDRKECPRLEKLPSSIGNLTNLSELDLSGCSYLVELPSSIGNLTNLQRLVLADCSSLVDLLSSIGNLTNLQRLDLAGCSNLVELPSSIGNLTNLQHLDLDDCSSLVELPSSFGNLQMLTELKLRRCSKMEILPNNINLGSLSQLAVTDCSRLRSFPQISTNIEQLTLGGTVIKEFPLSFKSWSRLQELKVINTEIEEFPTWFSELACLEKLVLNNCTKLVSLLHIPRSLRSLVAKYCDSLERIPSCDLIDQYISLKFVNCWKLNEEARNTIIQSSPLFGFTILPGREVPAFFTYRATTGGSLTVKLNQRSSPKFLGFKVCILLVHKCDEGAHGEKEEDVYFSWKIVEKQSGFETEHYLKPPLEKHLYIAEIRVENVESGELSFEFQMDNDKWEIAECGVREILEDPDVADSGMV